MASLQDLPFKYRLLLKAYPFRKLDPVPWRKPAKPLSESKLALITTAAFHLPDDEPFDERRPGGDPTYRRLPVGERAWPPGSLRIGHRSSTFDRRGAEADPNLVLPVDHMRALEKEGEIGALHHTAYSFMGAITAPGRLRKETAPALAAELEAAGVDLAFLTPV